MIVSRLVGEGVPEWFHRPSAGSLAMRSASAIVLGLVIATPALLPAASIEGDLDKLKGKWTGKVGVNEDIPIVLEFKDKEILLEFETDNGEKTRMTGEFLINEKASPKTIEFVNFKNAEGDTTEDIKGIYEFKGDALRICTSGPGGDRPTEFVPIDENGHGTVSLTRVK
jgi:uncharacterized protein (TIGR03067 family)